MRDEYSIGGMFDVVTRTWTGESRDPIVWYCGEKQFDILHDAVHGAEKTRTLLYAAEGAGKTVMLAQFAWWIAIVTSMAGQSGLVGCTAPTYKRLIALSTEMRNMGPVDTHDEPKRLAWGRFYTDYERTGPRIVNRFGVGFHLVSTKQQSAATGSSLQSFTYLHAVSDELQDSTHADTDIEARLRGSKTSRRLSSATAKDNGVWRSFRDEKRKSPDWVIKRIRFDQTPFVWIDHWDRLKRNSTPREWRRRGLAEDVASELATYPDFTRERNLRQIPLTGRDVAAEVFSIYQSYKRPGGVFRLLAAHDPGELVNTTVFLRPYLMPARHIHWFAVGELVTRQTTQDQHASQLLEYVRDVFEINFEHDRMDPELSLERLLVITDPHSRGDKTPDKDEYQSFRRHGFDIFPAVLEGNILRRTRIGTLNRLILNAEELSRFSIALDDDGEPTCPTLLASIEDQEREEGTGKAERVKKGEKDNTHASVATGYGVYPFEREAMTDYTLKRALKGVRS